MERIVTDLELDIKEIKYLLEICEQRPGFLPIIKRRIKEMQGHMEELLANVEAKSNIEVKEEITPPKIETIEPEIYPEQLIPSEPEQDNEPETIVHIFQEEVVTVEFADEEPVESDKIIVETEMHSFPKESILGERLRPSADLIKSMSLNDTFRFSRELFDGDTERMNRLLQQISEMDNFDNVMALLNTQLNVDKENESLIDFIELLRKYFA